MNVLNPSVVVLGGFLATLAEVDVADLRDRVRGQAMSASTETLELRSACLAEDRLLIGAAELAFAGILADPALPTSAEDAERDLVSGAAPSSP